MNKYNDYMDNISVDPALHSKIMQRATATKARPKSRTPFYTKIAASAAVFLLCVLMVPMLLDIRNNNVAPILPPYGTDGPMLPGRPLDPPPYSGSGENAPTATTSPSNLYPLNPNITGQGPSETIAGARIFLPGLFWHPVTTEQLPHILPDLGFPVSATVSYYTSQTYGEGTLYEVSVTEVTPDGATAIFGQFYTRTRIQIAPAPIFSCAIIGYDPVFSYVHGVRVSAGVADWVGVMDDNVALFTANFEVGGVYYRISLYDYADGDNGLNRLTEIVNTIIVNGPADLSVLADPVIPELRDERPSLEEAHQDPDFGRFMPLTVPAGFVFDNARRTLSQTYDGLSAFWQPDSQRMCSIWWQIARLREHDLDRIVSIDEREKFDLSLYPIPWMDSVPDELIQVVSNPIFRAEEITLEAVQARVLEDSRRGGMGAWISFGVLFDDVVVTVTTTGVSPEDIWAMLPR